MLTTQKLFVSVIIFILLLNFSSYGQKRKARSKSPPASTCALELKDTPRIRGIYLGMPFSEFRTLFPSATELENSRPEVGAYSYEVNQEENAALANSGVQFNFVWFVDGNLSSFGFKYPNYEPVSINNFVKQASAQLRLPSAGWKNYDGLINPKVLRCKEFDVMIGVEMFKAGVGDPYLILSDYLGDTKIKARENENKRRDAEQRLKVERERQIFKP